MDWSTILEVVYGFGVAVFFIVFGAVADRRRADTPIGALLFAAILWPAFLVAVPIVAFIERD